MDWVKTVNKLKGRLEEAAGQDYQVDTVPRASVRVTSCVIQEGAVKKILHRLSTVPMTLELLQVNHARDARDTCNRLYLSLYGTWFVVVVDQYS